MSTDMQSAQDRNGEVMLTQFWGGAEDGLSLQLTARQQFVSLTNEQAQTLGRMLLNWAAGDLEEAF